MPLSRRKAIVEVGPAHGVTLIENGALAPLIADAPPPLAALAPTDLEALALSDGRGPAGVGARE